LTCTFLQLLHVRYIHTETFVFLGTWIRLEKASSDQARSFQRIFGQATPFWSVRNHYYFLQDIFWCLFPSL